MEGLWKTLKILLAAIIVLGTIFFVSQMVSLYQSLSAINELVGVIFLIALLAILLYGIGYPIYSFLRLPRSLTLPEENDPVGKKLYRQGLIRQLNQNPYLRKESFELLSTDASDEALLKQLAFVDEEAETISRNTASQVFVTTAIIQNGSLDGLFVFVSTTRMIWHIAHLYRQRPAIKQLGELYFNVAATVLLAREIDDLELLDEQLEPLMTMIFGSVFSSMVPGATAAVNLIVNSTANGIANAYLTLRVGLIAQKYMGSLVAPERRLVRKSASIQACRLLGSVVKENADRIRKATYNLSKKNAEQAYSYGKEKASNAFKMPKELWEKLRNQGFYQKE